MLTKTASSSPAPSMPSRSAQIVVAAELANNGIQQPSAGVLLAATPRGICYTQRRLRRNLETSTAQTPCAHGRARLALPPMITSNIVKGLHTLPNYMRAYDVGDWVIRGAQHAGPSGAGTITTDAAAISFRWPVLVWSMRSMHCAIRWSGARSKRRPACLLPTSVSVVCAQRILLTGSSRECRCWFSQWGRLHLTGYLERSTEYPRRTFERASPKPSPLAVQICRWYR